MFGGTNPLVAAGCLAAGVILLLGIGTLLFQAGCALADVGGRGYLHSLLISSVAAVVCLPPAGLLIWFAGNYDTDPSAAIGPIRLGASFAAGVATWGVSAVIYSLFLGTALKKGLVIAGVELFLLGLLAALFAVVVLVILAFVQILAKPPPTQRTVRVPASLVRVTAPPGVP
jgi:hypothetical protein